MTARSTHSFGDRRLRLLSLDWARYAQSWPKLKRGSLLLSPRNLPSQSAQLCQMLELWDRLIYLDW
jgi:hypothetical protein